MITDDYYQKAKEIYSKTHHEYIKYNDTESAKKKRKNSITLLAILLKELCDNEKINLNEIEFIANGATSYVYRIGDKILKIGSSRFSKDIPKNPYILAPLLRRSFEFNDKYQEKIFIEITERVDIVSQEEVTEEDLYKLYSSLRNIGIEWVDIDYRNVGRLIKDNTIHWHEDIKPADTAISMHGQDSETTLKKGDLVIIDSDFIYNANETPDFTPDFEDDEWSFYKTLIKFRERYSKENKKKKTILSELRRLISRNNENKISKTR